MKNAKLLGATLLIASLVLYSCKKVVYYDISPEEEAEWMVYDRYEIINFQNSQGEIRTYKVVEKDKAYHNEYDEYIDASVWLLNDTLKEGVRVSGLYMKKNSKGLGVWAGLPHFNNTADITKLAPTVVTVQGKNFNDVYILPSDPFSVNFDDYIDTIYYSKKNGFIRYVDIAGEEWVYFK